MVNIRLAFYAVFCLYLAVVILLNTCWFIVHSWNESTFKTSLRNGATGDQIRALAEQDRNEVLYNNNAIGR